MTNNSRKFRYATKTEIKAATPEVSVDPSLLHHHPGVAGAWVKLNGSGTIAINASYNVSSITDNGAGDYTVNFTTPLSGADYAMAFIGKNEPNAYIMTVHQTVAPTASAVRIINPLAAVDPTIVSLTCFDP